MYHTYIFCRFVRAHRVRVCACNVKVIKSISLHSGVYCAHHWPFTCLFCVFVFMSSDSSHWRPIYCIVNNQVALGVYLCILPLQEYVIFIGFLALYVLGGFFGWLGVFLCIVELEIANRTAQLFYFLSQMYSNRITLANTPLKLHSTQPIFMF